MRKKDIKGMGHNNPPKELADLINDQGRVKINKEAMALLKPMPDPRDQEGKKNNGARSRKRCRCNKS